MKENNKLGYNQFFEDAQVELGLSDFSVARVIAEQKGSYKVKTEKDEYSAKVTGRKMFHATSREDYPAVGDWVAITELDNNQAVIKEVLPRKTIIKRKSNNENEIQIIATNIDVAFVVESINRDYNLNRFERYLSILREGGIKPVIVLNKIDLISGFDLDSKVAEIEKRFNGVDLILTSVKSQKGIEDFKNHIEKNKTYCFLGSSGVGKSSLINKLLEEEVADTRNISSVSDRGKHVTTSREMYFLKNGAMVIDNPGIREVGVADSDEGIDDFFNEISSLAKECKYSDCSHTHEPGCMVLEALESGDIDQGKYFNYLTLKKESDYYNMSRIEKKEKNRQFGKFINKAKKDFKKYRHKNY